MTNSGPWTGPWKRKKHGAFVIEGRTVDTQPWMGRVERYEIMLSRIMNDLGLTPKARIAMKLDKKHRKTLADMIVESQETEDDIE